MKYSAYQFKPILVEDGIDDNDHPLLKVWFKKTVMTYNLLLSDEAIEFVEEEEFILSLN